MFTVPWDWAWDSGSRAQGEAAMQKAEVVPELQLHVLQGSFNGGLRGGGVGVGEGEREMDATVWSRLPQDVVERVLLRLPSASRHRFQAVCSAWRSLMSCPGFLQESAALGRSNFVPDLICAFEYDSDHLSPYLMRVLGAARRRLTIPSGERTPPVPKPVERCQEEVEEAKLLSEVLSSNRSEQLRVFSVDLSFVPSKLLSKRVKSQGNGLLLCLSQGMPGVRCVINPMTRSWRELPPLSLTFRERIWAEEVTVDRDSSGRFNVVVIKGTSSDSWFICVYSSASHRWRIVPGQPYHGHRYFQYWLRFFIDNLVYSHDRLLGDLLIHNQDDGMLVKTVSVGFPPIPHMECACYELPVRYLRVIFMEHEGTVYGAFVFRSGLHHFGGISQLDQNRMMWADSVLLPDSLNSEVKDLAKKNPSFKSTDWTPFCCGTISLVGDCICFNLHSEKLHTMALTLQHVVAFHIPSRTWRILFPRAFVSLGKQYWLFEPKSLNVHL